MTTTQNLCPRCDGLMRPVMDVRSTVFEGCLMCGYEDYRHEQPKARPSGEIYRFRYGGSEPFLKELDKAIAVELVVFQKGRVIYYPHCPFCDEGMENISLSGKRINLQEERFVCNSGHRISLVPDGQDGMMVWI